MKTVEICENGECGGDCYRCRCARLVEQSEQATDRLTILGNAVAAMRHNQREYFRTRAQEAMRAALAAEARVDRLLADGSQRRLFGEPTAVAESPLSEGLW